MTALKQKVWMPGEHNSGRRIDFLIYMFGLSSSSGQRKEPTWTQAPSKNGGHAEPVWKDDNPVASYESTQQQSESPRRRASGGLWLSIVMAVLGLLALAYLLLSMVNVVEEQVARNQPQPMSGAVGGAAVPASVRR